RGHKLADSVKLPLVIANDIESLTKAKDLEKFLVAIGLGSDLERAKKSHKVKSGTARRRGRQSRIGVSALIVVGNDSTVTSLSGSIAGVDIKHAKEISVVDLAPGSKPIRLTLYSQNAINDLSQKKTTVNAIMEITARAKQ
ncbi:MAG TPA: 50S ribosomal protein L4, partial [Nitrososphaera sp.]|nr:50S ribosomal protein L4 [Nitrososphaera sp.]